MDYNIDQRKEKIIEILNEHGQVKVNELSRMFGISEVTIRFDRVAFANISSIESADYIITDSKAKRDYIELIKETGINIHTVDF